MDETENYFVYQPDNKLCEALGSVALSSGFTRIAAGSVYPPVRHPDDHHFVWERGRTLQAYQFALISEGRGTLQAAPGASIVRTVEAGDVLLLFPGVWHRFQPDQDTGWTENWIECRGGAFDRMMAMGLIAPEHPVWHGGDAAAELFARIHSLARIDALLHQPTLSTLGLQLLALVCESCSDDKTGRMRLAEKARRLLVEETGAPMRLDALAAQVGVSYSSLRRLFRQHTGQSLKEYQTEVRVRRACELLRSSDRSVKEIAGLLGYSSAFHFSDQFARSTGLAPSHWRQKNAPAALL